MADQIMSKITFRFEGIIALCARGGMTSFDAGIVKSTKDKDQKDNYNIPGHIPKITIIRVASTAAGREPDNQTQANTLKLSSDEYPFLHLVLPEQGSSGFAAASSNTATLNRGIQFPRPPLETGPGRRFKVFGHFEDIWDIDAMQTLDGQGRAAIILPQALRARLRVSNIEHAEFFAAGVGLSEEEMKLRLLNLDRDVTVSAPCVNAAQTAVTFLRDMAPTLYGGKDKDKLLKIDFDFTNGTEFEIKMENNCSSGCDRMDFIDYYNDLFEGQVRFIPKEEASRVSAGSICNVAKFGMNSQLPDPV